MDFNVEMQIIEETDITVDSVCLHIVQFLEENDRLDGVMKIAIETIKDYLNDTESV